MESLNALKAVIAKETRQTMRDRRLTAILLVAPILQLTVLGFAVNLQVRHVPTVIADLDHTPVSRRLARDIVAGDTFDLEAQVSDARRAQRRLEDGDAVVAVVIPRGWAADLGRGRATTVQVLVDGADSNRAMIAQNAMGAFFAKRAMSVAFARIGVLQAARGRALSVPRTNIVPRVFYNPTLDSKLYYVPGVAATLLLIVILQVSAMGLARERETGTLEQILVTPIRPSVLILGKTVPYAVIGVFDLSMVLVAARVVFGVPWRGNLGVVFAGGLLYILCVLGLGLLISALVRNQQQAFMSAFLFALPAILLSGFMSPISNMPAWLRPVTAFNPVRHMVTILRANLLKAAGFADLAPELVALAGLGICLYALAAFTLRRRLS